MPTALVCGDPHGQFQHIVEAAETIRPDAVLLLGDMEATRCLGEELERIPSVTRILWIPGNHDTDSEAYYDRLYDSSLRDGCLHGKIAEIAGLRFAGLGGVFRARIWDGGERATYMSPEGYLQVCGKGNLWRGGLPLRQRSTLFPSDIEIFAGQRADVLLTHEAPGAHPHGYAALGNLAQSLQVRMAYHGHHHDDIDYPDGVWHGVGLRQIRMLRW